jgi:deazaflavin-dependent oxidoreductase (nitroreductase family)
MKQVDNPLPIPALEDNMSLHNQLESSGNPRRLMRLLLRLPIWLYRAHMGWLLGHRFLMLTHIGRKSSLPRQVVLEVVRFDPATHTCIVASGWGEGSSWHQNVQKTPDVVVNIANGRFEATAQDLSKTEAQAALLDYARHNPLAFRELTQVMTGRSLHGTPEDCRLLAQVIPLVAFHARKNGGS